MMEEKGELKEDSVARGIKGLLELKDMSMGDVSRSSGLERSYVSRLANGGIKFPRINMLARVAKAFDMTLTEFIDFTIHLEKDGK